MKKLINRIIAVSMLLVSVLATSNASNKLLNTQITQEQYDKLQKSGTITFIAFNATWCPHCRKQDKSLFSIKSNYKDKKIAIYSMDWDQRKNYKIPYPKQRTTIVFIRNNKIIDQLIGEIGEKGIKEFLDKNLK